MKMESHGVAGRVHVSKETWERVKDCGDFEFEARGEIDVKGVGKRET